MERREVDKQSYDRSLLPTMASELQGKSTDNFLVRRATSLADLQWVMKLASKEDWRPRERDAECYFSAGITQDFFIGDLNGERVSCISVVRYGKSVAFIGYYIVAKPYRGQGYGFETWKTALASINDQYNDQQLIAVMSMKD